jgi:cation diffusion facilitator CzcD-associated flavoprotein CzcO
VEAKLCEDEEVALVGGGNSAGQAVVFLAPKVKHLHLVVRGEGLEASMSRYLIERASEAARFITLQRDDLGAGMQLDIQKQQRSATGEPGPRKPVRSATCFCLLAPIRMPNGSRIAFKSTTRVSW